MKRKAKTLGFTLAASLGLHGGLLLFAAWCMAVMPRQPDRRPASMLISARDEWQYRKGTSAPQADWKTAGDDALDSTWLTGPGWIGYGEGKGAGAPGTPLPDMRATAENPGYRMVYLRKTFTVSNSLAATDEAVLDIDYDDGFIAWVDGVYVDHDGPVGEEPVEPAWDDRRAIPPHECSFAPDDADPQPVRRKVLGPLGKVLPPGTHVLSVLLINEAIDSDDAVAKIDLFTRKPAPGQTDPSAVPDPEAVPDVTVTFLAQAPSPGLPAKPLEAAPAPPEELTPESAAAAQKKGEIMIYQDGSRPEQAPSNADTPFISNRNMRASSAAAATPGADPHLITQQGADMPFLALRNSDFAAAREAAAAPPAPAAPSAPDPVPPAPPVPDTPPPTPPVETAMNDTPPPPAPEPAPPEAPAEDQRPPEPAKAVPTENPLAPAPALKPEVVRKPQPAIPYREPLPDSISLTRKPQPVPSIKKPAPVAAANPSRPAPSPVKLSLSSRKTKSEGSAGGEGGGDSVDARDTPEGRYQSIVYERVGAIWNNRLAGVRSVAGVGVVEVEYDIDAKGTVSGVKLVDPGKSNAVLEDVCLTSIIKVKLPPPPEEMQRELRDPLSGGKIRCKFTFYRL